MQEKFKILIGEKIKEISTFSYHKDNRSEKFTTSGRGNYSVPKWENTQYKAENCIQPNNKIDFFVGSLKVLAVKTSGCIAFWDTAEKEELINLMLTMH